MKKPINKLTEKMVDEAIAKNKEVEKWSTWSLTPHTEDEIRKECLRNFDHVCFTYVCETSKLTPEFIEEFMVLSTGVMGDYYKKINRASGVDEEEKANNEYNKVFDMLKSAIMYNLHVTDIEPEKFQLNYDEVLDTASGCTKIANKYITDKTAIDRLDWTGISRFQRLPEWFIEKYANVLNWKEIFANQKLSEEFRARYRHKLSEK